MGVSHGCNTRDSESLIIRGGGDIIPDFSQAREISCPRGLLLLYCCVQKCRGKCIRAGIRIPAKIVLKCSG